MIPQTLSEANDLILAQIANSEVPTVLGFLPLSAAQEEAILEMVKLNFKQDADNSTWLFLLYPGATAYALAAAPSRALQAGGEFWPSLVRELGIDVPTQLRQSFAHEFRRECKHLGLLDGTLENAAWRYAAPFIFQSGILHYWKDDLAAGLRSLLRSRPAPDTEDPVALRDFTDALGGAIHHQANLRRMLDTEAGPLLVHRLVSGHLAGDWSRLPAHLREPVKEAFAVTGRGIVLRSPHLAFDSAYEELVVVLPAQPKGVASPETFWKIGSSRRHAARKETLIPVRELGDGEIAIGLHRLETGFEDRNFRIDPQIGDQVAFRIFRKDSGRELSTHSGRSADLPAGGYLVVTAADVSAGEGESPVTAEPYLYYDLDLRPGDPPLALERAGSQWSIAAKKEHGLFMDREVGSSAVLEDGALLLYGENPGIIGYFPADGNEAASFRLQVTCPEQTLKIETEVTTPVLEQGGYRFVSEIREPLIEAIQALPPGIHRLQVSISDKARHAEKTFWYWKGLEEISDNLGFRCSHFPENLDIKGSRGVTASPRGLAFSSGYHAPFVRLRLKQPSELLTLPRAGIRVTLIEPGVAWEEEPKANAAVTVDTKDKRLLKFTSGGFHPWKIMGAGREITSLDRTRRTRVFSLAGVAAEIGGSGRIIGRSEDGTEVVLLNLTRPLSASPPRMKPEHGRGIESWSFKIPTADLDALGVTVTDLSSRPDGLSGEVLSFAERSGEGFECRDFELPGAPVMLQVHCPESEGVATYAKVKVQLEIRFADLADGLWAIDFHRRGTGETDWQILDCDEKHGYSKLRIFAWGSVLASPESGWWRHLRRAKLSIHGAPPDPNLSSALEGMSVPELDCALESCRQFLEWKYPTEVWKDSAHRLQDFPVLLATHRFSAIDETAAIWWKHGAAELSMHSRSAVVPVSRQFLFGSQPECLLLDGRKMALSEVDGCPVATALNFPAAVAAAGGLKNHLLAAFQSGAGEIDEKIIFCFSNFMEVSSGRAEELSGFSLVSFLRGCPGIDGLEQRVEELHASSPHSEVTSLLGPEHLLHAIRAMNRRCRVIEESSQQDETTPLSRMAQTLERISRQLEMIAPQVAEKTGWNRSGKIVWSPPLLENPTSTKVAEILWVLCGLSRLAANRQILKSDHDQLLARLLDPEREGSRKIQNRICILLSLAPELFAFLTALFELQTFKPTRDHARP